jgi:hypothetical protein
MEWLLRHPTFAAWLAGLCFWVSCCCLIHMWLLQRAGFFKKLRWSFVVLIPLFGWLAYGGGFRSPDFNDTPCPENSGTLSGGTSD